MGDVFRIILSLSLSSSVLIVATLLICRLLKRHLSKRWQYYIWLLVVLRLAIPFSIHYANIFPVEQGVSSSYSADTMETSQADNDIKQETSIRTTITGETDSFLSVAKGMGYLSILPNLLWVPWLLIALALLIRKITLYQSFTKYMKAGKTEVSDPAILNLFAEACEQMKIKQHIELYTNRFISSPLLMGIRKPYVVLPAMPAGEIEFKNICLHELTHYKRGDIYYKWIMQIILCLHWFNPLVHIMIRETSRLCELSCDNAVLKTMSMEEREVYGDTLIDSLKSPGEYREGIAALTLSENASLLKERLNEIHGFPKNKWWAIGLSIFLSVCLFCGGFSLGVYSVKVPEPKNRLSLTVGQYLTEVSIDHTAHPEPLNRNIYIWDGTYPATFENVDSETYTWDNAYAPTMLPQGYEEEAMLGNSSRRSVRYMHENDGSIYFSQSNGVSSGSMGVDTKDALLTEKVIVNDSEGFLVSKDGINTLIWSVGNKLLFLDTNENTETLIAIAGGIKPSNYTQLPDDDIRRQERIVRVFSSSVEFDKQQHMLSFTIPDDIPPEYNFEMGVNVLLKPNAGTANISPFEEESKNNSWEPGKTYSHKFEENSFTDIIIPVYIYRRDDPSIAFTASVYIDASGKIVFDSVSNNT